MEIIFNKKRLEMKTSIDLIVHILDSGNLSEATLQMLLQEIRVSETSDGSWISNSAGRQHSRRTVLGTMRSWRT
ncbi:MAG: hypothetical protein VB055_11180 [Oscillospiraceae bacterium]|nr:hypothetical protein [Oscillospiraceae bacterium]